MEALFWGVCLRVLQSALQAAPFILCGLCIMGMFHRLMGQQYTRWLFGSNTVASLFQSWVIGMLLPGCSLGTIPIVRQLRRSGIAVGTIFAFALSSPLFDPLSILYGLTLSKPLTILIFALCSLVVVTVSGTVFDRLFPDTEVSIDEPAPTPPGVKRLISLVVVMAREAVSSSAVFIGIGLLGAGLLSLALPPGSLQRSMAHDNPFSPLVMTTIAVPAYATPMMAMGQLGSMFQHGNSIGAAFILLVFGAGMNLGLLTWMWMNYGWRRALVWMSLMLLVVIVFSYGIERPLYPTDIEPADHTHAFDAYCRPYHWGSRSTSGYLQDIARRVKQDTKLHELVGGIAVCSLMAIGFGLRWLDRRWKIEDWLNRPAVAESGQSRVWDVIVPGPVLAVAGLLAIVAFSFVGCFAYYPPPGETLDELSLANTEALGAAISNDKAHALHWIPMCESWTRRLQVGVYLRERQLSDYHRMKARVFLDKLEVLEHMLEGDAPRESIRKQISAVSLAYQRMSRAYRGDLSKY